MSFIEDYLHTMENQQPAKEYGIWSMLATLSAFAGRRFWFPFGPLVFYPNLYVVLVGEPGNGKSTAMNRGKNIVRASGVCPVAATQITKEALTQKMTGTVDGKPRKDAFAGQRYFDWEGRKVEYNQYAIFATELVEFIAVNPQGFLDFLTTVWDEQVLEVETKNKGCDYIIGPYITMLACMTPEKLKGFMKLSILTGGFARRTAFMFCSYKNIVHIPTYTDSQKAAEHRCVEFGKSLQHKAGPFTWTDALKEYYCAWNQENEEAMKDRHPNVRGWYQSKGEMLFKIAMLISLANDCGESRLIDIPHYKMAQAFCSLLEKTLERVFEGTGINPNAAAAMQICRMLEAMDRPMNRKAVEAMFFDQATSLNELRDTLSHLIAVGRLAQRDIYINGVLYGAVIGTPATLSRYSDVECCALLRPAASASAPPTDSCKDSSPSTSPILGPDGKPAGSWSIELRGL